MSTQPTQEWLNNSAFAAGPSGKSRGVFALLALFLGCYGIQYFYIGKTTPGLIFLLVGLFTCGLAGLMTIFNLVQAIMVFMMNNETFEQKFCNPAVSFPLF